MSDAAARIWEHRARAELEASARFERLAVQLDEHRAAPALVDLARRASDDERRHAKSCAELAARFGGAPALPAHHPAVPVGPRALDARERLLYEMVAMCCITETLSAALLIEMSDRTEDGAVKRTVHEILRDEVGHSRLGWAHLAAEHARGATVFLSAYVPAMLAETVSEELFWPDEVVDAAALPGQGALDRRTRREVFQGSMHEVVVPGLQRFGVDVGPALRWLNQERRGARWEVSA